MLCMSLAWNGVQAEDSMKGQPAPILEMGVKPKATPQELEQMRWMEIFANDIALYRFDVQSIRQNETDPDEVQMTVQAVYTDKNSGADESGLCFPIERRPNACVQ